MWRFIHIPKIERFVIKSLVVSGKNIYYSAASNWFPEKVANAIINGNLNIMNTHKTYNI